MSKRETPMILEYWRRVGGTLLEEFMVTARTATCGRRLVDAVIIPKGERRRVPKGERHRTRAESLEGKGVIVVQAKATRLGMYLMGQAVFSADLVKRFSKPASVLSVALCTRDDSVCRSLLEPYPHVRVEVLERFAVRRK